MYVCVRVYVCWGGGGGGGGGNVFGPGFFSSPMRAYLLIHIFTKGIIVFTLVPAIFLRAKIKKKKKKKKKNLPTNVKWSLP